MVSPDLAHRVPVAGSTSPWELIAGPGRVEAPPQPPCYRGTNRCPPSPAEDSGRGAARFPVTCTPSVTVTPRSRGRFAASPLCRLPQVPNAALGGDGSG